MNVFSIIATPCPPSKKLDKYGHAGLMRPPVRPDRLPHPFRPFWRHPAQPQEQGRSAFESRCHLHPRNSPGRHNGGRFKKAAKAYKEAGYPDEWKLHHQGGLCGFETREVAATPETLDVVAAGQVYAWNPSITGTKSKTPFSSTKRALTS